MKYSGSLHDLYDEPAKVLRALITTTRISITYLQEGVEWTINAIKADRYVYRGHLYTVVHKPECTIEIGVYKSASKAILLFGMWVSHESNNRGDLVVRLFPELVSKTAKMPSKTRKPKK